MKDKKKYMLFLGGITLGMVITSVMICFIVSRVRLIDKTSKMDVKTSNIEQIEEPTTTVSQIEESKTTIPQFEESTKNNEVKSEPKSKNTTSIKKEETLKIEKSDEVVNEIIDNTSVDIDSKSQEVLEYFKEIDNTVFTEENIKKFTSSVKTSFITITDFIFYGTEINGYTFSELSEQAKLYIMDIAMKIDAKIEAYHPGYKEEIKLKLSDIKEKITIKYLEVSDKICTEMGTVACNQAKQDLQTMKENFGLTLDFVKVITKSGLNSLKNWYEIFRESN